MFRSTNARSCHRTPHNFDGATGAVSAPIVSAAQQACDVFGERQIGHYALVAGGIERRLDQLGLTLPATPKLPPGVTISFEWIRIRGNGAFVSGHGPLAPDGSLAGPFGKVPSEVPLEAAQESARLTALAVIAGLKHAIGDLDRIAGWAMVNGFVNADPGYAQTTLVLNPFSDLILDVFGPEVGAHARTAVGVAAVPLNLPLVVSAQIDLS
jgi:enamine deaminase RidA (YjgF/YER057c/UK114 family)